MKTTTQFLGVILLCIPTNSLLLLVNSFYVPSETSLTRNRSRRSDSLSYSYSCSTLFVRKDWFVPDSADDEDKDDDLVTREMFQRDLLEDPQVKRKRKKAGGGGYKPLDNRDHLPFAVKTITPDPYTHPEIKNAKKAKAPKTKKSDLDHQLTASKLYQKKDGKDTSTLLGEFKLDKCPERGEGRSPLNTLSKDLRRRDKRFFVERNYDVRVSADVHIFFMDTNPLIDEYKLEAWGVTC